MRFNSRFTAFWKPIGNVYTKQKIKETVNWGRVDMYYVARCMPAFLTGGECNSTNACIASEKLFKKMRGEDHSYKVNIMLLQCQL